MAQQKYYLFNIDSHLDELVEKYNLPQGDYSYFVSGFLVNKPFSDEEYEEHLRNNKKNIGYAGRKSNYYFGENLLEDHDPKTNEPFSLIEQGGFIITLAGPGYNNTNNETKFKGDWEKPAIKDNLTIKPDFTWERSKEIDPDFFLNWNGTYTYKDNLLVFSLKKQGYSGLYFSGISENYIPYYGLMYGPINNSHSVDVSGKVLLSSFLDDSFSDFTNTYKISGTGGMIPDNKVGVYNPGGRGKLLKYFAYTDNLQSDMLYDVGSCVNNTNSKINISGFPDLEAVSGNFNEFAPYDNNFGGVGGNVIENSLDLYEKNTPENGYVKIQYSSPYDSPYDNTLNINTYRALEITTSGIEVLPDETAVISGSVLINRMLVEHETDVYYRILDRSQELDLEKSTLNGRPLFGSLKSPLPGYQLSGYSLSGYNIKYEESKNNDETDSRTMSSKKYNQLSENLYIVELDNHRRKMSFMTPFRSNKENPDNLPDVFRTIELNLKTAPRKFYFAIARDNQIDEVWITTIESPIADIYKEKTLFHPDDKDKDGIYRKIKVRDKNGDVKFDDDNNPIINKQKDYGFYSGDYLEIEIRFKNEANSLMKELISYYLSDCLEPNSISKSNNFIQTINPFIMPQRDVLLFLKTESTYMLNIFISEDESKIIRVEHEGEITNNDRKDIPIFISHFRDDEIIIEIWFDDPFSEIDKEDIENQLPDVDDIKYNDKEAINGFIRTCDVFGGWDISVPLIIRFLMPSRNVNLYLRQKDYRKHLNLLMEKKTKSFKTVSIFALDKGIIVSEWKENPVELKERGEDPDRNEWKLIEYYFDHEITIKITVHYEDIDFDASGDAIYYYAIDGDFLRAQLASIKVDDEDRDGYGYRELKTPNILSNGFKYKDQWFSFTMPENGQDLIIKEKTIKRTLTVRPEPYQYLNPDKNVNVDVYETNERKIEGIIFKNDEFKSFEGILGKTFNIISEESNVDLYVKFSDIYMHLDKDYIAAQIFSKLKIEEAGKGIPGNFDHHKEYYQHIRFNMTQNDLILVLKWEERLFGIYYNIHELFFKTTSIFDLYKRNKADSFNGKYEIQSTEYNKLTEVGQSRFPYFTYPYVMVDGTPQRNRIAIFSSLTDSAFVDEEHSVGIIHGGSTPLSISDGLFNVTDPKFGINLRTDKNNLTDFTNHKKDIFLRFFMKKSDIDFYIVTEVAEPDSGRFILFSDEYTTGRSISLNTGHYIIWAGAGRGGGQGGGGKGGSWSISTTSGHGGNPGYQGATIRMEIIVENSVELTYKLGSSGQIGGKGADGESGFIIGGSSGGPGGHGGGGGTTVLTFSSDVKLKSLKKNDEINSETEDSYIRSVGLQGGNGSSYVYGNPDDEEYLPGRGGRQNTGNGNDGSGNKSGARSVIPDGILPFPLGGSAQQGDPGDAGLGFKYRTLSCPSPNNVDDVLENLLEVEFLKKREPPSPFQSQFDDEYEYVDIVDENDDPVVEWKLLKTKEELYEEAHNAWKAVSSKYTILPSCMWDERLVEAKDNSFYYKDKNINNLYTNGFLLIYKKSKSEETSALTFDNL